ncbi:hypothetical protein ACLM5H_10020 [Fredinandcohnia humi]
MLQKIDKTYWVVLLIIGGIIGILSGYIGPDLIHQIFFKHGDTFWVITPFSANIFMFVATGFFVLFCIGMIYKNKVFNYIGIMFFVFSIATGCYALLGNYILVSMNDITTVKSMTNEVYEWNEITEATYLDKYVSDGRKIQLTFQDGKEETLEINDFNINKLIEQILIQIDIQVN